MPSFLTYRCPAVFHRGTSMKQILILGCAVACLFPVSNAIGQGAYPKAPLVLPETKSEWREPSYWISQMDNPDAVILTPDRIEQMNAAFSERIRRQEPFADVSPDRVPNIRRDGFFLVAPDVFGMAPGEVAGFVREQIAGLISAIQRSRNGNAYGIAYDEAQKAAFVCEMAADAVPDEIVPLRGLVVKTTRVRTVPDPTPFDIGLQGTGDRRYDMFNRSLAKIGQPVAVLFPSQSGEFLFTLTDRACGWVRAEDVALTDEAGANRFADPGRFVVCTGDRVMYYTDESCRIAAGAFAMGDRLPLAGNDDRQVRVPVRRANGQLAVETAWLRAGDQVSVGYLPYTRRNIVITAFALLDNYYDWTEGYLGRNHETTFCDIFACFGFELPWHGAMFTVYSGTEGSVPKGDESQLRSRFAAVLEHEPFVSMVTVPAGHTQLLLGQENGEPIVFDNHGYNYTTEEGETVMVKRTVVGTMSSPGLTDYMLVQPLVFTELK